MNQCESSGSGSWRPRRSTKPREHYTTTIFPIPEVERAKQIVLIGIRHESLHHLEDDGIDDFLALLGLLMDHIEIPPVNAQSMEYIHRNLHGMYGRYLSARSRQYASRSQAKIAQNEFYCESNRSTNLCPMVQEKLDEVRGCVNAVIASMLDDETSLSRLTDEAEKARIRELINAKQAMLSRFAYLHAQASVLPNMVSSSQPHTDYLEEKFAEIAYQERRVKRAIEEKAEIDRLWRTCVSEHPIIDL